MAEPLKIPTLSEWEEVVEKLDGANNHLYAVVSDSSGAKLEGPHFTLKTGDILTIYFETTVTNMPFNVYINWTKNNTWQYTNPVKINGSTYATPNYFVVGSVCSFIFDGEYWILIKDYSVIPVSQGGTGQTSVTDTVYTAAKYRASSLHSSETIPATNGVIAWTYE